MGGKKNAQISLLDEIIVDNFAGGGGASTGIELACGRPVTIAINHDPEAIKMHMANHPYTEHYQASVWDIDPVEVCRGRPVGLAWFSPDCKHFSRAKGGKPVSKNIRGLAWIALRWAAKVKPRVIILENVPEFVTWGPVRKGKPVLDIEEYVADYLLENNVFVAPVTEGDSVYVLLFDRVLPFDVISVSLYRKTLLFKAQHGIHLTWVFNMDDIGKTVFLTREEAEKALKEREQNG